LYTDSHPSRGEASGLRIIYDILNLFISYIALYQECIRERRRDLSNRNGSCGDCGRQLRAFQVSKEDGEKIVVLRCSIGCIDGTLEGRYGTTFEHVSWKNVQPMVVA